MRKKASPFFALLILVILILGCGRSIKDNDAIVVWHWMNDRDEVFQELAKRYEAETGKEVIFELYAPSVYSKKITAAAQARILPDIFGILNPKSYVASFIKSGFVANLSRQYARDNSTWEKSLSPSALASSRFEKDNLYDVKPGIYGVPIDISNIKILYNKRLLEKAGITEIPKNFEEFIVTAQALSRVGISGLVTGWGEEWMVDCFASNYAFNIMGEEKVLATFRGDVPYTDPDWIAVLRIFERLRDNNVLAKGIVTKSNKDAEQDFALERAAFAFNGSWCVNVYQEMNPNLEYGSMLPPPVSDKYPMKIWGGAGSTFMVNKNSPKKYKAIAFLRWLSSRKQQIYLSQETRNLPSNHFALPEIPEILSEFAQDMDHTTDPKMWALNEEARVTEKFVKGIQSIIIGEKTPEEVAQEVQELKEKLIAKKKKE